jgi:hypothetical protein
MNTVTTVLGNVEVTNVSMNRASGYGQYTISIEMEFDGEKHTANLHSTDSQLWDAVSDLDSNTEREDYLISKCTYAIEEAVNDYISSL